MAICAMLTFAQPVAMLRAKAKADPPTASREKKSGEPDPAAVISKMSLLVGGTWRTTGDFVAEFQYRKVAGGKAIRGEGVIGKGTPQAMESMSMFGIDP